MHEGSLHAESVLCQEAGAMCDAAQASSTNLDAQGKHDECPAAVEECCSVHEVHPTGETAAHAATGACKVQQRAAAAATAVQVREQHSLVVMVIFFLDAGFTAVP
jgi:hypothetical protein